LAIEEKEQDDAQACGQPFKTIGSHTSRYPFRAVAAGWLRNFGKVDVSDFDVNHDALWLSIQAHLCPRPVIEVKRSSVLRCGNSRR
jgi:hypothetical protein